LIKAYKTLGIWALLFTAAAWKGLFIALDAIPFNSDEAVVGLMARHILIGERPAFFYGQAYMGSLDAYLVAMSFSIFGTSILAIRLVQMGLYLITIFLTYKISCEIFNFKETGLYSAALLSIPVVNLTLYTTASLGGYGEAMVIGCLLMYMIVKRIKSPALQSNANSWREPIFWGLWGLLFGLGLWSNALSLVFGIPAGLALFWDYLKKNKRISIIPIFYVLIGFLLGSLPWWIYAWRNGADRLIFELFGSAVSVETGSLLSRLTAHLFNLIVLGGTVIFGIRPPWEVRWLALPLIPAVLIFWTVVTYYWIKNTFVRNSKQYWYLLLAGVPLTVCAGFLFTSFGADPSGRYFLPLAIPFAIIAGNFLVQRIPRLSYRIGILVIIIVFNAWGTLDCAFHYPPGITTQFDSTTTIDHRYMKELAIFLEEQGEFYGYSNYWVAYPLIFSSNEQIIFVPRLPYHLDFRITSRDDRYSPYTKIVSESKKTAYITTRHPPLDSYLREEFTHLQITWKEKYIGDYHVFYGLSAPVRPDQIGLGSITQGAGNE